MLTLVQRWFRVVAGGEPVPSNDWIRNDPPPAVADGVHLMSVSARQGRFAGACVATVVVERIPLVPFDIEWSSIPQMYGGAFGH